jgi:hypothetical protein
MDALRDDGAQQVRADPERGDQQRVDTRQPGYVQQFRGVERGELVAFGSLDIPDHQAGLRPEQLGQPGQGARLNALDRVVGGDGLGEVVSDAAGQPPVLHQAQVDDVGLQVLLDGVLRLGQDVGDGQVLPDAQARLARHGAQAVVVGMLLAQPVRLVRLRIDGLGCCPVT